MAKRSKAGRPSLTGKAEETSVVSLRVPGDLLKRIDAAGIGGRSEAIRALVTEALDARDAAERRRALTAPSGRRYDGVQQALPGVGDLPEPETLFAGVDLPPPSEAMERASVEDTIAMMGNIAKRAKQDNQRSALELVQRAVRRNGQRPTAKRLGVSKGTIAQIIRERPEDIPDDLVSRIHDVFC